MLVRLNRYVPVLLLCAGWLSGPAAQASDAAPQERPTAYKTQKSISYWISEPAGSSSERCVLDLYYPSEQERFPTVIWFHAGGLKQGNRYIPGELRNKGWAVAGVSYRLYPDAKAPEFIEDAAAATAWVFQNIENYGGDPSRIVVAGASAGAYLSAMIGFDKQWLGEHGIDADRIAGLGLLSGQCITHFAIRKEKGISGLQPRIDTLAPLYHVRGDAPPVLLVTGDRELELMGRYEENAYFMRMLKLTGHPDVSLHEIPGKNHGQLEAAAYPFLVPFIHRVTSTTR